MMEALCTCEDLPPHQHVPESFICLLDNGAEVSLHAYEFYANQDRIEEVLRCNETTIRLAVDWKAVARSLMADEV